MALSKNEQPKNPPSGTTNPLKNVPTVPLTTSEFRGDGTDYETAARPNPKGGQQKP